MKILVLYIICLISVRAGEIKIKPLEKNESGFLIANESPNMIFVYMPCSLDFRVISGFDNPLREKADDKSKAENHRQASISEWHGFFVEAGKGFIIDYPPGYEMKTFPEKVILRLRYRKVVKAEEGKLLLEEYKKIDITLNNMRTSQSEAAPKNRQLKKGN